MQKYCLGFAFNNDKNKIVLILKQKPSFLKDKYNGIGGKIEEGETSEKAMEREFLEETGVLIPEHNWIFFTELKSDFFSADCYYTITDDIFNCRTIESEEIHIVDLDKISNLIFADNCLEIILYLKTII